MNPAIVVIGYNRPQSLLRLLKSIAAAKYPSEPITLIISIDYYDGPRHDEVVGIAEEYDWKYGKKIVSVQKENLGLKAHILQCGDLTETYDSVVILEDDLIVSPQFYEFSSNAIQFYHSESRIAGISLYAYEYEELGWFKFYPRDIGTATYFMQWSSSWGQIWTRSQWREFRKWYTAKVDIEGINAPDQVKNWKNSWKKFHILYLVDTNRFFVFPYKSYTTLMDGAGTHHQHDTRTNNVALVGENKQPVEQKFSSFPNEDISYDSFFQPLSRSVFLEQTGKEMSVDFDLYGTKRLHNFKNELVFGMKHSDNPILKCSNKLIPLEDNLYHALEGEIYDLGYLHDLRPKSSVYLQGKKLYSSRKVFAISEMAKVVLYRVLSKMKVGG
ncbi:hypothetical protein DN752_21870 [Echinicola strongylocentroti]|uniref:Glycosyltransferase 2-like domain-containing protein n=1 Tax=Echinicola strongylocentroti TaxID=1795355 RepID=A0A2Z4INB8_9BACT|nr:glycosyltransferase [Echinicola strongylocentroti]AWW32582.1 hypothetical protein DN752_21870 [Echinicola strongylocentroti]